MASSTPGYCTFTATTRPSANRARCTWPIEAAATGIGSHSANTTSGASPSSARTTDAARLGAMGGASACSWARAAWASGGRASPRNDSIWPSFMTAPLSWPSSRAASCAERMANSASRSSRRPRRRGARAGPGHGQVGPPSHPQAGQATPPPQARPPAPQARPPAPQARPPAPQVGPPAPQAGPPARHVQATRSPNVPNVKPYSFTAWPTVPDMSAANSASHW